MKMINPYNVRPCDLEAGDKLGYKIVAVIGRANDWAAYAGETYWSDERTANEGDKISKEAAEALFYAPVAAGLKYRL